MLLKSLNQLSRNFQCAIWNSFHKSSHIICYFIYCTYVFFHPGDARITVGPVETPSLINGDVTLTCTASGIPLPSVMWLDQDSGTVVPATDMIINDTTIMSTLTLTSLQADDFGSYECTATNMFDNDTETAFLGSEYHIHHHNLSLAILSRKFR